MKTFDEYIMEQTKRPLIFCDMDGVLVDFEQGASKVLKRNPSDVPSKEMWETLDKKKDFWATLPVMPDGKELWKYIDKFDARILSAKSRSMESEPGKRSWIKQHLGSVPNRRINIVWRADKIKFAHVNGQQNILIDDYKKNIKEFEDAGGIGILHKNTKKTISELKKLGF